MTREEAPVDERTTGGAIDPLWVARRLRASYTADLGDVAGFLPHRVPLDELPAEFAPYLSACSELPLRYSEEGGGVRCWLDRKFATEVPQVRRAITRLSTAECESLMTVLGALAHTYRWDRVPPAPERFEEQRIFLPPGISAPWAQLARVLDQPLVGTTWSLHLCNWKLADRPGGARYHPEQLGTDSLRIAHNWLLPPADAHLERFSLSFVLFEAQGTVILRHLVDAIDAAASGDLDDTFFALQCLHSSISALTREFCINVRKATVDPAIWRNLVQPTFAWSAEGDEPRCMVGGPSGLQLPTLQALDSALGIVGDSTLARLAVAGRGLMPKPHRRFLYRARLAGVVLRRIVSGAGCPDLIHQYNRCIDSVIGFRTVHRSRAVRYLSSVPENGVGRVSTGLTIGLEDDPVAVAEETMSERIGETQAAALRSDNAP